MASTPADTPIADGPTPPRRMPAAVRRVARRHPLAAYVVRRVAVGVALVFVVATLVFAATQVLPGDAASVILGRTATPETLASTRAELGLDRPVLTQYVDWLGNLLSGDLGTSYGSHVPVADVIGDRIVNSLALAAVTVLVMFPLAIALGVVAGTRRGRPLDHVVSIGTLAFIALPEFLVGTILATVVAVELGWLPPVSLVPPGESPFAHPDVLVLPAATLCIVGIAYVVRMVRAGVSEAMQSEYVDWARLNGIAERRVVTRHALRNALAPTVQVLALTLQWLIGGIIVVEAVFAYPGIGQLLVQAVVTRDLPLVQALAVLIAVVYIAINVLADVIVVVLIPKLRTSM